jgi:YbbR domain-containing protein
VKAALGWFASNLPLMILAIILAPFVWFVAVEEEDPTVEERYPQPIPITLSGLSEGMAIVDDAERDKYVQFTVRAPQSVWDSLEVEDFTASINLAGLSAGTYQAFIQWTLDKQPARVLLVEPECITLSLDRKVERSVPVHVQLVGKPALGYLKRSMILEPSEVTVIGPSTYVTRAVEAVTSISVQDASADVEGRFQLQLRDSEGKSIPHVTFTPEVVTARVPIEQSSYYRALPIRVVLEGQVAPGYRVTAITVEPPTITLFGAPDVLDALPGFIETEPINMEGAQEDVIERPVLNKSPDVMVVPGQELVRVEVSIEAIQSSLTVDVTPELQGLEPSFTATVSPETVEVILSGALPLLETLEADDVRIILELFSLPVGIHQIEPQMVAPEGLIIQSVNPATVQVEIVAAPAPTPTEQEQ